MKINKRVFKSNLSWITSILCGFLCGLFSVIILEKLNLKWLFIIEFCMILLSAGFHVFIDDVLEEFENDEYFDTKFELLTH